MHPTFMNSASSPASDLCFLSATLFTSSTRMTLIWASLEEHAEPPPESESFFWKYGLLKDAVDVLSRSLSVTRNSSLAWFFVQTTVRESSPAHLWHTRTNAIGTALDVKSCVRTCIHVHKRHTYTHTHTHTHTIKHPLCHTHTHMHTHTHTRAHIHWW